MLEDEVAALAGLKERAHEAFVAAVAERAAAEAQIIADLEDELFHFLQDRLGVPRGDAAALEYKPMNRSTEARKDDDPASPSTQIAVEVKLDGVKLRGWYRKTLLMKTNQSPNSEFSGEEIYDDVFVCEVDNGRGWTEFKTLASLGALLS